MTFKNNTYKNPQHAVLSKPNRKIEFYNVLIKRITIKKN
jgi:hypothetical protein